MGDFWCVASVALLWRHDSCGLLHIPVFCLVGTFITCQHFLSSGLSQIHAELGVLCSRLKMIPWTLLRFLGFFSPFSSSPVYLSTFSTFQKLQPFWTPIAVLILTLRYHYTFLGLFFIALRFRKWFQPESQDNYNIVSLLPEIRVLSWLLSHTWKLFFLFLFFFFPSLPFWQEAVSTLSYSMARIQI